MLPARHRMRHGDEFARAIRSGSRGSSRHVVVHLLPASPPHDPTPADPARVGFVVSKAVGGAVQRNKVRRRLREIVRARLSELPDGALVVVRALPSSAAADFAELSDAVERSLGMAIGKAARTGPARRDGGSRG